jgi:hypothetical protein
LALKRRLKSLGLIIDFPQPTILVFLKRPTVDCQILHIDAKSCLISLISWKAFSSLANRSAAGRARVRVVVTIEEERRVICAPCGGRNRMSTLDALRMLDMDNLRENQNGAFARSP